MSSTSNTSLFASQEDTTHQTKNDHSASILAQKDDLNRIKIEIMASRERNDNMDEYLVERELSTSMIEIVDKYKKLLDVQSTTIHSQARELIELSSSDFSSKRNNAAQRAVVNSLMDQVAHYKSNERRLECRLTQSENMRKYVEDELAASKSELANNDRQIKELSATALDDERKACSMNRRLDECMQECTGLYDTVARLNAELENARLNADRLYDTLEYERMNHSNESRMNRERIRDLQLQCDELSCKLDEEKKTEATKLASQLLDAGKTRDADEPAATPMYFEIEDLLTECETGEARIRALKNEFNATATATTNQCCGACHHLPDVDKSCRADTSSEAESESLATRIVDTVESTATTIYCDCGTDPAEKFRVDVQGLLDDLHGLSRDVQMTATATTRAVRCCGASHLSQVDKSCRADTSSESESESESLATRIVDTVESTATINCDCGTDLAEKFRVDVQELLDDLLHGLSRDVQMTTATTNQSICPSRDSIRAVRGCKSCCADTSSSSSSPASLATRTFDTVESMTSMTTAESTATTTYCDCGIDPAENFRADVQGLLDELHDLIRDVQTMCKHH